MKALTLRLDFDEDAIHPMHAFVAERPEYGPTRLLQWNPHAGETNVMLFHVDGPEEPFLSALGEVETAEVVEPSAATGGDGFYLYVRERLEGSGRELIEAYAGEQVVVAPPITYDVDGSMRFTVVGDADTLQRTLDRTPDEIGVSVQRIRSGVSGAAHPEADLSDRQREVVTCAVAAGYYEEPREATVADVADRVGCAASTAAEHLRKAESALVKQAMVGTEEVD